MFDRLFRTDAPFWEFMGRVGDLIIINILTVVLSIPVLTIGASLTALTDVTHKLAQDVGGSVVRLYLTSWWANLRQATALWLLVAVPAAGTAALWLLPQQPLLLVLKVLASVVFLLVFPFVWALQARFENSVLHTVANAVMISLGRLPYSAAILVIDAALVALTLAALSYLAALAAPLLLLGLGLLSAANEPLLDRALQPWLGGTTEDESRVDQA
jgi:hypothetical protein